jgi:hypothetical protein
MTIKAVVFDAYGTLYDVQSVAAITEEAFPGYGEIVTQIWRIKQLEYTWLRSLMRRYEDFSVVTRDSLVYTLRILGLKYDSGVLERITAKYLNLDLYPDAAAACGHARPQARDTLEWQHRHTQGAGAQQRARPRAGRHYQHRLPKNLQAGSRRLRPDHPRLAYRPPRCCLCRRTHGTPAAPRPPG